MINELIEIQCDCMSSCAEYNCIVLAAVRCVSRSVEKKEDSLTTYVYIYIHNT